jgi:hypothetical protein
MVKECKAALVVQYIDMADIGTKAKPDVTLMKIACSLLIK